ncbi:MAG: hypothetical protein NTAFB09_06350 [Nitrosospira sp.]
MLPSSSKKIILFYAKEDEAWEQRLQDRLASRTRNPQLFPAGLAVESWNNEKLGELIRSPEQLHEQTRDAVYMLFLVSDDLLKSPYFRDLAGMLRLSLGEASTFRMLRVHLRPLVFSLDWLESAMLLGPESPALAELPREQCDSELDRIADAVIARTVAAMNIASTQSPDNPAADNRDDNSEKQSAAQQSSFYGPDEHSSFYGPDEAPFYGNIKEKQEGAQQSSQPSPGVATEQPEREAAQQPDRQPTEPSSQASGEQPPSPSTSDPGVVPLAQLAEFRTAPSISLLMERAVRMASSNTTLGVVTTSFLLFTIAEATDTEGPWTAHFLRNLIDSYAKEYGAVRDHYFSRRGSLGLKPIVKGGGFAGPIGMTSYLFSALERSRDIAQRTTNKEEIHGRHLLAALLADDERAERSGALKRLAEMGLDPVFVREALHEWVRGQGDLDQAWEALLIGESSEIASRRLSGFSTDRAGGEDLLGIQDEVRALAVLIAARTVVPPLSIGLFGEWGSGKTFFMRQLRNAIDELAKEARTANRMQRDLPIYKNIVQIEFNAWHYVEGNLWASLVEHILDNLYPGKETSVSQTLQKELISKLAEEKALSRAASNAVDSAKAAATVARGDLDDAQRNLDEKTRELAKLNAEHVGKDFLLTGAHQPVLDALTQLNLTAVGSKAVELEGALRQIHGVLGRGQRFLAPLMHAKDRNRRFAWLFFSLLGVPVMTILVRFVLQMLGSSVADIYAYAAGLATLIGSGVPWLKQQAEWMSRRLGEAEAAQKKFDEEMATQTAEHVRKVTQAEQKLRELTAALDAAQQKHAEAKAREAAAAAELKAATAGRLLANFITDRAASSDYRKHLGVLALVRDDFEKLSGLIEEDNWALSPEDPLESPRAQGQQRYASLAEEEKDKDRRINRIVLYIDDLDRCPPNKVVEVLQAVHLLLAFPLFVVVVGVDARWIKRSLQARYHQLLHVSGKSPDGEDGAGLLLGSATPNDYLEKIFQIPFWLRPMDAAASDRMVRGLLQTSIKRPDENLKQTTQTIQSIKEPAQGESFAELAPVADAAGKEEATSIREGSPGQDISLEKSSGAPAASAQAQQQAASSMSLDIASAPTGESASSAAALPAVYPAFKSLETIQEELDFMSRLAPILGRSPRALKRFVNVYRLIKAGLSVHEARSFLQPNDILADYQAVLFLLAVDTGMPLLAHEFFSIMEEGLYSAPRDEAPANIAWMIKRMNAMIQSDALRDSGSWRRMRDWLDNRLGAARTPIAADTPLSVFAPWMQRVARFSFEPGRS